MEVKTESQAGVALVGKAFQILDLFQPGKTAWSQADITRETGLNRSTVNRLVRFLVAQGYMAQSAYSGRYTLGLAAIDLGNRANASFDLRAMCQPAMEELSEQTNETVVLSALDPVNRLAVCVDQIEGRKEGLRVFERVGSSFPLHAGAAPKAILAFLPEEMRAELLSRPLQAFTANTVTSPEEVAVEAADTRARGFAQSWEETFEGTAGVAVPILGPSGTSIGSLAVALPVTRAAPEVIETITGHLLEAARAVNAALAGKAK